MQALIDFDGWRNWKDFAALNGLKGAPVQPAANKPAVGPTSAPNKSAAGLISAPNANSTQKKVRTASGGSHDAGGSTSAKPQNGTESAQDSKSGGKLIGSKELSKDSSPDTVVEVGNS